jgi:hypothetical protein
MASSCGVPTKKRAVTTRGRPRVRVDVLDTVDRLHDDFQRLGDELDRILRLEAVSRDKNIHHGHRDLRLFLSGEGRERDQSERQARQQDERGQRRLDECA